jgi:hypothetical protein
MPGPSSPGIFIGFEIPYGSEKVGCVIKLVWLRGSR